MTPFLRIMPTETESTSTLTSRDDIGIKHSVNVQIFFPSLN